MEKLTLDQLEVQNFAVKLSEKEIDNIKGRTTTACMPSTDFALPFQKRIAIYRHRHGPFVSL